MRAGASGQRRGGSQRGAGNAVNLAYDTEGASGQRRGGSQGGPAVPAAEKVPEPIETSDMAPLRSPIIRSNPEQKEKQQTRLESREPKKDSVTKRVS